MHTHMLHIYALSGRTSRERERKGGLDKEQMTARGMRFVPSLLQLQAAAAAARRSTIAFLGCTVYGGIAVPIHVLVVLFSLTAIPPLAAVYIYIPARR